MVELPNVFRNILNISAAEISFRKQNMMALLCSIKSDIVKIEKCTLGRLVNICKYITDNDIDMKFGPNVINSAVNSWKK